MRWFLKQAWSAFLGTALILALILIVSVASDEGGVSFHDRLGRVLPTAPIASGLGVYLAVRRAQLRGELRLLSLLGIHPAVKDLAYCLGALLLPLAISIWLVRGGPIEGFFPPSPATVEFRALPSGEGFQSERIGMRWTAVEGISSIPETAQRLASIAREPAAVVVTLLSAALALFASRGRTESEKGKGMVSMLFALTVATATLAAFQLAASGYVGAWWTVVPAIALLASELIARTQLAVRLTT